jgi:hypothetical protein
VIYHEYADLRKKYIDTQRKYEEVLTEKENLFAKTLPSAIKYDSEKVKSSSFKNTFDDYLIKKEEKRIDERLEEAKTILDGRRELLVAKKEELQQSSKIEDTIYLLRYVNNEKIKAIAVKIGYSESQIHRVLKIIRKSLKDDSKC